jgi:sigma-B regulation protein RsbU (phosphoserine phosphatase)
VVDDRFEAAPCGLLQTSEAGLIQLVNNWFCQWVGYHREDLVGKRRLQDLLTMGGRIFHHTHWAPLLRMQSSVTEVKLEVQHRDGHVLPMIFNAVRVECEGGAVHEIAAYVARDRDRYEQELVRSRRRLEELIVEANELHVVTKDRALFAEQMIGIVSHDLRNPLSAIQMGTTLLAESGLPEASQRIAARISRATDRATRLIEELLDFTQARIGRGIAVTRAPIDLHQIVAETLDELRLAHPHHVLEHVRVGEGPCSADASRLAQLLGNLVSNAIAYGDPAQPIVVTSALAGATASLSVHNAGKAIDPALQLSMFEPMTRGVTTGTAPRSVGLGLYIVREIARAHSGTATVTSAVDAGTTFAVAWPRDRVTPAQ